MLLNQPRDFSGGGTRFHEFDIGTLQPANDVVIAHYGKIRHEGVAITRGKRYLLVGFIYARDDCEEMERSGQ